MQSTVVETGQRIRGGELRALAGVLKDVAAGHSSVGVVSGDPGMGKTWLLAALADQAARQGLLVLTADCLGSHRQQASSRGEPYGPLLAALRGGSGDQEGPHHPDAVRARLAQTAAAAGRGVVVVIDDFHAADEWSVDLVAGLLERPLDEPLAVVVACRPRQSPLRLQPLLDPDAEYGARHFVELDPLTPQDSAALLGLPVTAPRLRELHRAGAGVPLYLTAQAAVGSSAVRTPAWQRLSARLLAEVHMLSPFDATVLAAASVLGDGFDGETVAVVARLPTGPVCESVAALVRHDLVRPTESGALVFRHPLLLQCVYEAMDACERGAVHRRALRHLRRCGRPPLELVRHAEGGASGGESDPEQVYVLIAAAEDAVRLDRAEEAGRWLARAMRMARWDPVVDAYEDGDEYGAGDDAGAGAGVGADFALAAEGPDVMAVGDPGGRVRKLVARELAARGSLDVLGDLRREMLLSLPGPAGSERAEAVAWFVTVETLIGSPVQGRALAEGEIPRLRDHDRRAAAALELRLALARLLRGIAPLPGEAAALARTAAGDPRLTGGALALRGMSEVLSDPDPGRAARTLAECAAAIDGGGGGLGGVGAGTGGGGGVRAGGGALAGSGAEAAVGPEELGVLGWGEALIGRHSTAAGHLERAVAAARAAHEVHLLPTLLVGLSLVRYRLGDVAAAHELVLEAHTRAAAAGAEDLLAPARVLSYVTGALLSAPDSDDRSGCSPTPGAGAWWRPLIALLLAEHAMLAGDTEGVRDLVVAAGGGANLPTMIPGMAAHAYELFAWADEAGGGTGTGGSRGSGGSAGTGGSGGAGLAAEWADRARARVGDLPVGRAYVLLAAGHAGADGPTAALRSYEAAFELFAEAGMVCEQMRVLLTAAPYAAGIGQGTRALRMLDRVERLGRRHGVPAVTEHAARRRRELGPGGTRPVEVSRPALEVLTQVLTQREWDVARLAGEGLKTRDIALQLRISPRTVGVHLTRIYAKLNLESRAALAAVMARVA
jgi:DNA-binding CsgD family transcriptional regulator/uncharacterized membrane protein YgcG